MDSPSTTSTAIYPHRDPPLTDAGHEATKKIKVPGIPDLIVISPMTRTIQTALNAFPSILGSTPFQAEVQIWPNLREAHGAICNQALSRAELSAKFPQFSFCECPEEWDHPPHTIDGATARAEVVRQRVKRLSTQYRNIVLVTHRGFIAFLVKGDRYDVCETRSYRFGVAEEAETDFFRVGINVDTEELQDLARRFLCRPRLMANPQREIYREFPKVQQHPLG
ncbi:hypothetical protein ANOM_007745 [Aspergillus nomiae NRRL 13137]|uniref:Phosphoglycerate mutase family protein n=1 Tax=Aspergillus nomiae NRRL (strain ATCC 15546 / NRRL 13137 / CBS 260.88 / M93) TaxID=1509407 RepID=A0A0L1IVL0_ASPN3|nr:uncharacterized protein ANOM_007745 [Aspergillus nomiae NRRL 13137]KNG83529.1 hypothetical protein ANOM_007745 [Aspergillus nomiae NRRL 13137]